MSKRRLRQPAGGQSGPRTQRCRKRKSSEREAVCFDKDAESLETRNLLRCVACNQMLDETRGSVLTEHQMNSTGQIELTGANDMFNQLANLETSFAVHRETIRHVGDVTEEMAMSSDCEPAGKCKRAAQECGSVGSLVNSCAGTSHAEGHDAHGSTEPVCSPSGSLHEEREEGVKCWPEDSVTGPSEGRVSSKLHLSSGTAESYNGDQLEHVKVMETTLGNGWSCSRVVVDCVNAHTNGRVQDWINMEDSGEQEKNVPDSHISLRLLRKEGGEATGADMAEDQFQMKKQTLVEVYMCSDDMTHRHEMTALEDITEGHKYPDSPERCTSLVTEATSLPNLLHSVQEKHWPPPPLELGPYSVQDQLIPAVDTVVQVAECNALTFKITREIGSMSVGVMYNEAGAVGSAEIETSTYHPQEGAMGYKVNPCVVQEEDVDLGITTLAPETEKQQQKAMNFPTRTGAPPGSSLILMVVPDGSIPTKDAVQMEHHSMTEWELPADEMLQSVMDSAVPADEMLQSVMDSEVPADEMLQSVMDSAVPADEMLQSVMDSAVPADEMLQSVMDSAVPADEMLQSVMDSEVPADEMLQSVMDSEVPAEEMQTLYRLEELMEGPLDNEPEKEPETPIFHNSTMAQGIQEAAGELDSPACASVSPPTRETHPLHFDDQLSGDCDAEFFMGSPPASTVPDPEADVPLSLVFLSDSQLVNITPGYVESGTVPEASEELDDATTLVCGLIKELSSLNRTVMVAHRELESLRRGNRIPKAVIRCSLCPAYTEA